VAPVVRPVAPVARVTARGVARRTARRTARRVTVLPRGYTTVVVSGSSYYLYGGVYYEAVFVNGRTYYYVVTF
jgi:hypothetical protein